MARSVPLSTPMRRSSRQIAAAAVLVCVATAPSLAQQPAAAPVADLLRDPGTLVAWLAAHSPDAGAAAARVAQARAVVGASLLRPNPQVSASVGGIPVGTTNPAGLGLGETVNFGATASQTFEIGKRQPRSAAARLRVASETDNLAGTLISAAADAREAIARLLYAKSRRTVLAEELRTAREILDLQRVRLDRGDLSGVDFDRLQLETEMLESDVAQASAELDESLATCAAALFAPCDTGPADLDTLAPLLQAPDVALPAGWDALLKDRPDLKALELQQQAFAQDAALALRRRIPDPIVSAGYTRDRFLISGNNPRTLAVGVTIPLALFDRGQHDAARALAQQRELAETATSIAARARAELDGLRRRQASLTSALDALKTSALTRADTILTTTESAVNQGELSTTDLLLARRARADVTLKLMDLQLQLYLVQNDVRQLLGTDAPAARQIQGTTWPAP
jgi:cobalt-zinc-cadmium efflux system outer membrane protein